ncbi:hypothetical protein C8Q70DRAFT_160926 [Cubamyces menziesii]|nr:hypothetical protein C8Q70DRAFT_160926 [Cubamyces menziesii]
MNGARRHLVACTARKYFVACTARRRGLSERRQGAWLRIATSVTSSCHPAHSRVRTQPECTGEHIGGLALGNASGLDKGGSRTSRPMGVFQRRVFFIADVLHVHEAGVRHRIPLVHRVDGLRELRAARLVDATRIDPRPAVSSTPGERAEVADLRGYTLEAGAACDQGLELLERLFSVLGPEELKIITLPPTNPSQPAAGPVVTLSDARMRLAGYIRRKWPKALFRDSSNWAYDLLWVDALDMDGAPSGTVLLLHFNDFPDKDRDMFHGSASMFREVLKVTKTILRLPEEAEPRWFYHPASSRSSLFEFDLDRCFRHDYPPERNTRDSSA